MISKLMEKIANHTDQIERGGQKLQLNSRGEQRGARKGNDDK